VAIVGDIVHSRVARSDIHALTTLGVPDIRAVGPKTLVPGDLREMGVRVCHDMAEGIRGADVIIMLRLQNERMSGAMLPSAGEFFKSYGLTPEKLALAKPDAIVMHPGPINRGVEIDSAVADGAHSVILPQVTFGIAVRMAVMSIIAGNRHEDPDPNGRVIDPASGPRRTRPTCAIAAGRIVAIGAAVPADFSADARHRRQRAGRRAGPGRPGRAPARAGPRARGHARSELAAAAAGGVTSLVCPPDTDPVLDEPGLVEMLKFRARKLSRCRLFPLGALTRGLPASADRDGRAHRGRLRRLLAGRRARSPTPGAACARCSTPPPSATPSGCARRTRWLGKGVAPAARWPRGWACRACRWRRDHRAAHHLFELVRITGARVHLCRLSSAAGVALLRAAKAEGLPVTADVSINSLHLTDVDIGLLQPRHAPDPPLRQGARPRRAARRRWPTAPSTRWCPTTTRSTT
jgi:hypothetical protein